MTRDSSLGSAAGTTRQVQALYEQFPYPNPRATAEPILDVGFALSLLYGDLTGLRVLDAGCGTGHRLVGMAESFPDTEFLGVDFSSASVDVALSLVEHRELSNVGVRRAEIGGDLLEECFDLVVCTGVIHHLESAEAGVRWLADHVKPEGSLYSWHYHRYGEFDRLLTRKLVRVLTASAAMRQQEVIDALGAHLSSQQYGTSTAHNYRVDEGDPIADMDAFAHPIVNAYTVAEAESLLRAGFAQTELFSLNLPGRSILATEMESASSASAHAPALLDPVLASLYDDTTGVDRWACIELLLRPTGFSTVSVLPT